VGRMKKLKLNEEQQKFLENNFNNFSEELINSTFRFVFGGEMELKDYCTMEGIERQLTKANGDNMTAAFIFYAHMYYPEKWRIEKMVVRTLGGMKND
jgi:arginine utilization protein RocB